jgi:hypothetical protein
MTVNDFAGWYKIALNVARPQQDIRSARRRSRHDLSLATS